MTAKWKMPGLFAGADADKCYREITGIGETATPEQILEFAKNPESELHKCFEWDDSIAAYRYRLQQARTVVCHLVVVPQAQNAEPQKFRLLQKTDAGYKPTKFIYQNKTEYEKLLERAMGELRAFKQRYHNLVELEEILALID